MSPRKKPAPREAPAGRDENVPLTASELAEVNKKACAGRRQASTVVREPVDNIIGKYKLLQRIDGLFVLHDMKLTGKGTMGNGPVFWNENGARTWAGAT